MSTPTGFTFRIATEPWEFEQIHRLNYRAFVEEIPQHNPNGEGVLVDKFHTENTYVIAVKEQQVIGMLAMRDKRPFSLDAKLSNLNTFIPPGRTACEIRLLTIDPAHRGATLLQGLILKLIEYSRTKGYNLALISGTTRQIKLYRHLGFKPFAHLVGTGEAQFQPMMLTLEDFATRLPEFSPNGAADVALLPKVNLMPGPVAISQDVRRVFADLPVSHRGAQFVADVQLIKESLRRLSGAKFVEILMGSGTLGNDTVAGQIAGLKGRGLVVTNGEFGGRLVDHARRWQLDYKVLKSEWGEPLPLDRIARKLDRMGSVKWLWMVHCETSSGIVNDLPGVKRICRQRGIKLCLDCMSSLGAVPLDLRGVYMAASVSGKALAGFPGLALIFYNHRVRPQPQRLPRYLDIGYYAEHQGLPYTISTNLVYALKRALETAGNVESSTAKSALSTRLRAELRAAGFNLVGEDQIYSPAVITIVFPPGIDSVKVGDRMMEKGYLLSYRSYYLVARNWLQICLMGEQSGDLVMPVVPALVDAVADVSRG
ncbi:MAG: aminotransferase class V-fold PLP-dependent enzyme [Calditrichaeota bacterium]|nr:aminotransferase class V-fold PLP-dependent enzyme [Calditrichota bacterium]